MKNLATLLLTSILIFSMHVSFSQNNLGPSTEFFRHKGSDVGPLSNVVNTIDYPTLTFFDKSRVLGNKFDNTKRKGSYFLFNSWDNYGKIQIGKNIFTFTNINFDIEDDKFMSKMQGDSILVFDSNYIDNIIINNKSFKYIYNPRESKSKMFEVLYQSKNRVTVLKGYYLKVILSSPNPMLNRSLDEIKKRSNYYVLINDKLSELKLQKKTILKFIDKDKLEMVKKFVSKSNLSCKNENDVIRIFKYYDSL